MGGIHSYHFQAKVYAQRAKKSVRREIKHGAKANGLHKNPIFGLLFIRIQKGAIHCDCHFRDK